MDHQGSGDAARQALLIMDMQQAIVDRFGASDLADTLAGAASRARAAGVPVLYVKVVLRPGYPEVHPRNLTFSAVARSGWLHTEDPGSAIHERVLPEPGDVVIEKRRVSAFAGSDLALVTSAQGIDTLVLAGIATSGVVLSTLREAADRDYGLVVLRDGCADDDPEVHRVLMDKVFPHQAAVTTIEDWCSSL